MIDTTTLQKKVDAVKTEIRNDSITPLIIGTILSEILSLIRAADLTDWKPGAEQAITDLQSDLSTEIMQRSSADNELRASIALLRRALDESEDGTFAQSVREDIRDIIDALALIRDDQKLAQEDIDSINAVIDGILGENASDAIENFQEILNFLEGVKDTDSLLGLLDNIRQTIRDNAKNLQTHESNDKTHINVLSLANEDALDDATGAYVRPGLYRVRLSAMASQPDRDGDLLLFNVWGRWDYIISAEDGTWSVPVYRMKIDREGVWVQSGTYNSDNLYSHGQWQSLTSLLLTVKIISDTKADRTELSNILGTPTEGEFEALEPGIVTTVLRKIPQALTPEEQAQVKNNLAISKMELFIDLFNAAAGPNGYARITDGEFDCELNKLKLTYEEAVTVLTYGKYADFMNWFGARTDSIRSNTPKIRTTLPTLAHDVTWECKSNAPWIKGELEVINLGIVGASAAIRPTISLSGTFYLFMKNLKAIMDPICPLPNCMAINTGGFTNNLEEIYIKGLDHSFSISALSKLSLNSFIYLVSNAANTTDITVTVHPDVYAKLTDEANTDWHQVLLDAADKNITFATV